VESRRIRVLLVDDDPEDAALLRRALCPSSAAGFEIEVAESVSHALTRVAEGGIDIAVLDLGLADSRGLDAVAAIRSEAEELPLVVLADDNDHALALAALNLGAQDYLIKGVADGPAITRALLFAIERRRCQARLDASETLLAEAQRIARLGSWEWEIAADQVSWTDVLYDLHEVDRSGPAPTFETFISTVHVDDREGVQELIRAALDSKQPFDFDYRVQHPHGEERILHGRGHVVVDQTGRAIRMAGTCQDITARRRLEQQVHFASRMATVGTLGAGVAHEINNPLACVLGNVDLAAEEIRAIAEGTAEPRTMPEAMELLAEHRQRARCVIESLADMRAGAERIRSIVRDLMTFARSDDGERSQPVSIHRLIESSIHLAWNEIRHRARLVKEYKDSPIVQGNESRLGQVFLNLLVNAAQAITEGDAEHNEIRISMYSDPLGQAILEVRDTGCGISPSELKRIFDPFFTTKPVGMGTGLGLSVSHSIVSAMGGELQVESRIGSGSLFQVVLPTLKAAGSEAKPEKAKRQGTQRRGRVLAIDDDDAILTMLRRGLGLAHEVTALESARRALELLSSGDSFDVILCDLMMPDMTGIDFYEQLAELHPEQADRVVFLTGGALTPLGLAFLERVSNARMLKPFDVSSIQALIRTMLQ